MSRNRIVTLLAVLALAVFAAVGSWMVGSNIQSPAEVAARTAPPTPSPILVPVEQRVLSSDIVTRGTARFGLPKAISIAPSTLKPDAGVVTTLPSRNQQLRQGAVLLTASGRPVFVLKGKVPTYRDLVPGIFGEDVLQLEKGLGRIGFDAGAQDGAYDAQTSAAVSAWYESSGWQPFGATNTQQAELRALERELARAVNDEIAAAAAAAAAPRAVEAARADANSANQIAAAEAQAKTAALKSLLVKTKSRKVERRRAQAEMELAQAAATAAQKAGEVAIQAAIDDQRAADREAKLAEEIVKRLRAELERARGKMGVQIPADEIVFVPSLPVRVEEVQVAVGDPARGSVMTVTNNQLAIDSSLRLDEAPLVKQGMPVAIDEPAVGIKAEGVVKRVAGSPGTDGVDGYHIYFEVLVEETSSSLEGFSLRLTIPIKSTGGKVTAVPVSALSLAADGTSRVQVNNHGALEFIVVEPGLSADGFVEVTPVDGELAPGQLVVVGYENYQ